MCPLVGAHKEVGDLSRAEAFDSGGETVALEGDGPEARLPNVRLNLSAHTLQREIGVVVLGAADTSEMSAHAAGLQARQGRRDVDEAGALVDGPRAVAQQRRSRGLDEGAPYWVGRGRGSPLAQEGGGSGGGGRGERGAGDEIERRRYRAGQACVAVCPGVDGDAGALGEAELTAGHDVRVDPPISRGPPGAEGGGLHVARGAKEDAHPHAERDVAEDALVERGSRRADGQCADAGAGA